MIDRKSFLNLICVTCFIVVLSLPLLAQSEAPTRADAATTPLPEPALALLFHDNFDGGELLVWGNGGAWSFVQSEDGQALESRDNTPLRFLFNSLANVAAEIRFQTEMGLLRLTIRETADANYSATLSSNGQLTLTRGGRALASATLENLQGEEDRWHHLRIAAFGDTIRVSVDGEEIIAAQDPNPLPAGGISIRNPGNTRAIIDDFQLWAPISQLPPISEPEETATPAATTVAPDEALTRHQTPAPTMIPDHTPIADSAPDIPDTDEISRDNSINSAIPTPTPEPVPGTATDAPFTLTPAACAVMVREAETVMAHTRPNTTQPGVAMLPANTSFIVSGQAVNETGELWYRLNEREVAPGQLINAAWVAAGDVTQSGDCHSVPEEDPLLLIHQFQRIRLPLDASMIAENRAPCAVSGLLNHSGALPPLPFFVYPGESREISLPAGNYFLSFQGNCASAQLELTLTAEETQTISIEARP